MSRFYRQSNGPSGGGGGGGASDAGSQGAVTLFGGATTAVEGGNVIAFGHSGMKPELKSAVNLAADAYSMPAADASAAAKPALEFEGLTKSEFSQVSELADLPEIDLSGDTNLSKLEMPEDLGKMLGDLIANMGDFINQLANSPMGFIGGLLSLILKIFTEISSSIIEYLSEIARAAAAAIEEALKKQFEMASSAQNLLQPVELYNQAAVNNAVSQAMKTARNAASIGPSS